MSDPIKITDPHHVQPIFVNQLASSGFLNGVVNLAFATALFVTPKDDGTVEPDLVISCQLRMDLYAAQMLRDRLTQIIDANTKPPRTTEH